MDKDFEKWLKQDELFDYYKTNPEQQDEIFKDYQREKEYINPENIDEWVKWLCNNPELAEKQYSLTVNNLKERVQNTEPFLSANIIQNIPENFIVWKTEINNHNGKYREKKIKEQITLLNGVLNEWQYPTKIEQQAVESVRPYLVEQLEYWESELKNLPPQSIDKQQNRTKQLIVETFENMDKKGWQYAFSTEQDYNLFTNLLTNFFEYKDYSIPETAIQLKRSCKTKVAKALGEIHKELSNENKLSTDTEYFNIIRVLSHFQNEKERDLYKALTR
tara:strand:- start:1914 stop:2741 length:828 start_codon:yes stop_codon:yes gene_type:complete